MPRIKLAHWHGDHAPGEEIDVTDEELAGLTRDGRVAGVVDSKEAKQPTEEQPARPEPSPELETQASAPEPAPRKRR